MKLNRKTIHYQPSQIHINLICQTCGQTLAGKKTEEGDDRLTITLPPCSFCISEAVRIRTTKI